jgi:hypothetical protein
MNIFALDRNPRIAAQCHCDVHVRKMTVESAQILCTVNHLYGTYDNIPYKSTHVHHPCVKWACESQQNYNWLCELGIGLAKEFTFRFGRFHKTESVLYWCRHHNPCPFNRTLGTSQHFALCMPERWRGEDGVSSYRRYYAAEKADIAKWTKRSKPPWWLRYKMLYYYPNKS